MGYEAKDNTASLFLNDRKREGKEDADYTGTAKINGVEMWANLWKKEKDGKVRLSMTFREKVPEQAKPAEDYRGNVSNEFDSDIPF